ncbi:MAG: alpha/beta fold hydrolase [Desulfobacterales bacterium]|nr:alpha/beta fold hydrolase [Desulfobacterales bacterium]
MINPDSAAGEDSIEFTSEGFLLKGRLHLPEADRPPFVVGSHGLLSSGDSPKQISLARACAGQGIAFFRFDHRGCGNSSGLFQSDTSLAARCADLQSAVDLLLQRTDLSDRFGLFGSSFGGTVCLSAAGQASVSALVVNAAPVRSRTLSGAEVTASGPLEIDESFYREKLQFDVSEDLPRLGTVLVFHGDEDRVVPVENAHEIYETVGRPKKLSILEGGDHMMSRKSHQTRFVRETVEWFKAHLAPEIGTI